MTQGASSYFQSDSDFDSRLSNLKDKIREFFNLKKHQFPVWLRNKQRCYSDNGWVI